ncbi:hypothetical protein G6F63_016574 [Rhizopus arrhizus]|nr:hypothetical protein G6F63_016574 [Rhizopus arrhizus]
MRHADEQDGLPVASADVGVRRQGIRSGVHCKRPRQRQVARAVRRRAGCLRQRPGGPGVVCAANAAARPGRIVPAIALEL